MGGFCEKLLPSDRWSWSDVSGLQHRPLDGVELPSPHWEWESDWYVDENFGGEPTEKGVGELRTLRGCLSGSACPPVPPSLLVSNLCWLWDWTPTLVFQGWTYAMDFPATYTKDKKWNSCVRRRKWIRYRRYKSRDTWAKVFLPQWGMGVEHRVPDRRVTRTGIFIHPPTGAEGDTIPTLGHGF